MGDIYDILTGKKLEEPRNTDLICFSVPWSKEVIQLPLDFLKDTKNDRIEYLYRTLLELE